MTIIADRILQALPTLVSTWLEMLEEASGSQAGRGGGDRLEAYASGFLTALARDLCEPVRSDYEWRSRVRHHGELREEQGGDITLLLTEFQLLRELLWELLLSLGNEAGADAVLEAQRRIDRQIDLAIRESVVGFVGKTRERWSDMARRDSLTRLYNRSMFYETLMNEISRAARIGGTFSVVMVDLNFFKRVNDTFGHLRGDQVLSDIAGLLRDTIRAHDAVFRYGGDEFALLLPGTMCEGVDAILNRFAAKLDAYRMAADLPDLLGVSWGVATYPIDATEPRALVAAADRRLYVTKPPAPRVSPSGEAETRAGA